MRAIFLAFLLAACSPGPGPALECEAWKVQERCYIMGIGGYVCQPVAHCQTWKVKG
jgi:hypothetical protein